MNDPVGGLVAALFALAVGVSLFLLFGRAVGWLLGISTISKNQMTIIEQNENLIAQNEKIIEIMERGQQLQRAVASKQDAGINGDENSGAVNLDDLLV